MAAVMAAAAAAWAPGALGWAAFQATASAAATTTYYTTTQGGTATTPVTTSVGATTPPATTTRLTCTTTYTTPPAMTTTTSRTVTTPPPSTTCTSCTTTGTVTVPEPPTGPSVVAALVDARTGEFYARGELNVCSGDFCAARVAFDVSPGPQGALYYDVVVVAYKDGVTVKEVPLNLTLTGPTGTITLISEGGAPVKLSAGQDWRTEGTITLPGGFDATRYTTVKASARAWVAGAEYRAQAEAPVELARVTVVVTVSLASKLRDRLPSTVRRAW